MKNLEFKQHDPNDQWKIYSIADAYKPRPPLEYVVQDICPLESLGIFYGAPGSMKSMILADMALCAASGQPFLEPLPGKDGEPYETKQVPVMWIDFDNGSRVTHERIEAISRARNLPENTPFYYVSLPRPPLNVGKDDHMMEMLKRFNYYGIQLAIIDNLGLVSGGADINSDQMIPVMANLRWLTEETKANVNVIHHQRKSNGVKSRKGERLLGHTSIEASLNYAFLIEREELSETITVQTTKTRGYTPDPFSAMFTYSHKAGTHRELETARFWHGFIEDTTSNDAVKNIILEIIENEGALNKTAIKKYVKQGYSEIGENRIDNLVDILEYENKLRLIGNGGNGKAKTYQLATVIV